MKISSDCFEKWMLRAGTKEGITRTLTVKNEAAYNALVNEGALPTDYWQKGKCTVNYESDTTIEP